MSDENLHFRLCLMLAFQTVVAHSKQSDDLASKAIELAKRMQEFCNLNVSKAFPPDESNFIEDPGAAQIDAAIALFKEELRTKEQTRLPENREELIHLHGRLQQRKARRGQEQFYATVTEDTLADSILHLLDEELKDANAGTSA